MPGKAAIQAAFGRRRVWTRKGPFSCPSVAMSVRTRPMFAIPFAVNLGSVAVISRRCGILGCNERAHGPRMFAGRYIYQSIRMDGLIEHGPHSAIGMEGTTQAAVIIAVVARPNAVEFSSTGSGNKARHAGPNHRVEPEIRLDALPNLPHGVFRQSRHLKVLLDIARCGRGGQESGAALYGPGQRNLSRRLVDALRDCCDYWVVHYFRTQAVSQRCKR